MYPVIWKVCPHHEPLEPHRKSTFDFAVKFPLAFVWNQVVNISLVARKKISCPYTNVSNLKVQAALVMGQPRRR
jgi:hypothetical protein